MKFLVLSVLVCAANAATFGRVNSPFQSKAFASASVFPTYNEQAFVAPVAPVPVVKAVPVVSRVRTEVGKDVEAVILKSESEVNPDGFSYAYESSNGIGAQASGVLKRVDNNDVLEVRGSYNYINADGEPVNVAYIANENGYQPDGAILPTPHPIPVAIARALEYIATHPQKDEYAVRKN